MQRLGAKGAAPGLICTPAPGDIIMINNDPSADKIGADMVYSTLSPSELAARVEAANRTAVPTADDEADRLLAMINASIIEPTEDIEPDEFLFSWQGVDCLPRQNIVSLKAPAKAGKTFALTALSAAFLTGNAGGLQSFATEGERLLFVDTEQSRNSTRKVLRRILKAAPGTDNRVRVLNVRQFEAADRLAMIRVEVQRYRPSMVIVDGVIDLVPGMDYNDLKESERVITTLATIAEDIDGVVVVAIHTNNKDGFATGWMGRALKQKAAAELEVERAAGSPERKIKFTAVRDRELPPIGFVIEDTPDKLGAVRIISAAEQAAADVNRRRREAQERLVELNIVPPVSLSRPDWVRLIMEKKTLDPSQPYRRDNADKFVRRCITAGAIVQDGEQYKFDVDKLENDPEK